jgi:hypothetical protein
LIDQDQLPLCVQATRLCGRPVHVLGKTVLGFES